MSYEGPRGTRKEEFSKVMELVDSIFVSAREKGTSMEKGFPLLFNQRNLENMRDLPPQWKAGLSHRALGGGGLPLWL